MTATIIQFPHAGAPSRPSKPPFTVDPDILDYVAALMSESELEAKFDAGRGYVTREQYLELLLHRCLTLARMIEHEGLQRVIGQYIRDLARRDHLDRTRAEARQ
jgi:hypothetical protein